MKFKEGRVSFIVPVYNGASFIEGAYMNILNQKLQDFEIIFVDNNSTDASLDIIKALQKTDGRVQCYKESTQGAAVARNKGLKHANGEFIHFYDVDDRLFDTALLDLLEVLNTHAEIASVFGKMKRTSSPAMDLSKIGANKNSLVIHKDQFLTLDWLKHKSNVPGPPCFLHRRTIFNTIKGFNEELLLGEDVFFHVQLSNEFTLAFLDREIYHYYRHPNSTVSLHNRMIQDKVFTYWPQTIQAYVPYSKTNGISEEFKREVLKQVFWSIGKMIVLTKGFQNRNELKKQLELEISPIKTPFFVNILLRLIQIWNNYYIFKFYYFYIVTPYFNFQKIKKNEC